jgi:hypothetical protein
MALIPTNIYRGAYVPTTYIFDPASLQQQGFNKEQSEFMVRLYQNINNIINVLNIKDSGYYLTTVFNTSQSLFSVTNDFNNLRPIFRVAFNFGALPVASIKSVPHNIPTSVLGTTWSLVRFDITSTDPNTRSISIPGFDPSSITNPINAWFDPVNVNIQTTSNMSAYTITNVVIEFVQM